MELSEQQSTMSGYGEAFRSLKAAKNLFWVLLLVAILVQVAGFLLVDVARVADSGQSASQPATASGSEAAWRFAISWLMSASKLMGFALCLSLMLTLALAVQLSLLGRLGGIGGLMGALFWTLILLLIVTPWQRVLGSTFVRGALSNLQDITKMAKGVKASWGASSPTTFGVILYYVYFLVYPLLALAIAMLVQLKFSRGMRASSLSKPADVKE